MRRSKQTSWPLALSPLQQTVVVFQGEPKTVLEKVKARYLAILEGVCERSGHEIAFLKTSYKKAGIARAPSVKISLQMTALELAGIATYRGLLTARRIWDSLDIAVLDRADAEKFEAAALGSSWLSTLNGLKRIRAEQTVRAWLAARTRQIELDTMAERIALARERALSRARRTLITATQHIVEADAGKKVSQIDKVRQRAAEATQHIARVEIVTRTHQPTIDRLRKRSAQRAIEAGDLVRQFEMLAAANFYSVPIASEQASSISSPSMPSTLLQSSPSYSPGARIRVGERSLTI